MVFVRWLGAVPALKTINRSTPVAEVGIEVTQGRDDDGTLVPVSAVLQTLHDQAPADHITLEWLTGGLEERSFGMIILILALISLTPGISPLGGALLWIPALQMMLGRPNLWFPRWMAVREIPTRHLGPIVRRAIPVVAGLERIIHPRFPTPPEATKRIVGAMILLLTARLLLNPIPMSNILPAALIAFIALAYLEQDGLLLIVGLLAGCLVLMVDLALIWQLVHHANAIRLFGQRAMVAQELVEFAHQLTLSLALAVL